MFETSKSRIPSWVADWSLILGIIVLLVTFVNYGMSLLYPEPEYADFCGSDRASLVSPEVTTPEMCTETGGLWQDTTAPRRIDESSATTSGYCDTDYYCRAEHEAANDIHDRNGLIVILILGLIISAFGFTRKRWDVVATSSAISGIIVIISGLMRYWNGADDWAQFILLGSLLVAFVYLALREKN